MGAAEFARSKAAARSAFGTGRRGSVRPTPFVRRGAADGSDELDADDDSGALSLEVVWEDVVLRVREDLDVEHLARIAAALTGRLDDADPSTGDARLRRDRARGRPKGKSTLVGVGPITFAEDPLSCSSTCSSLGVPIAFVSCTGIATATCWSPSGWSAALPFPLATRVRAMIEAAELLLVLEDRADRCCSREDGLRAHASREESKIVIRCAKLIGRSRPRRASDVSGQVHPITSAIAPRPRGRPPLHPDMLASGAIAQLIAAIIALLTRMRELKYGARRATRETVAPASASETMRRLQLELPLLLAPPANDAHAGAPAGAARKEEARPKGT